MSDNEAKSVTKGRILIADDNPVNQELLEAYLQDHKS